MGLHVFPHSKLYRQVKCIHRVNNASICLHKIIRHSAFFTSIFTSNPAVLMQFKGRGKSMQSASWVNTTKSQSLQLNFKLLSVLLGTSCSLSDSFMFEINLFPRIASWLYSLPPFPVLKKWLNPSHHSQRNWFSPDKLITLSFIWCKDS